MDTTPISLGGESLELWHKPSDPYLASYRTLFVPTAERGLHRAQASSCMALMGRHETTSSRRIGTIILLPLGWRQQPAIRTVVRSAAWSGSCTSPSTGKTNVRVECEGSYLTLFNLAPLFKESNTTFPASVCFRDLCRCAKTHQREHHARHV